jgi:RecB family endonuclease NucS
VLRRAERIEKAQLTATLLEYPDALERGMLPLGAGVSCSPLGTIDLLALDRSNQLVVVEIDAARGDELIARGIAHVDWVARNVDNVQRMFHDRAIDRAEQPRLMLVAPEFSPLARSAARQLAAPRIACFRYLPVALAAGTGILIEPLPPEDA